jgi:Rha family phage regulatory protein
VTCTTGITDSRVVVKHLGKRHDNVLRAFDKLECSQEFDRLNFEVVEEADAKGEMRRSLNMTKDGFMFMAIGFTGPGATRIRSERFGQIR